MQEVVWLEEVVQAAKAGSLRTGPLNFADRVFQNDLYMATQQTRQVCCMHLPDTLLKDYLLIVLTAVHSIMHEYILSCITLPGKLKVEENPSAVRMLQLHSERTLFAYAMTCGLTRVPGYKATKCHCLYRLTLHRYMTESCMCRAMTPCCSGKP